MPIQDTKAAIEELGPSRALVKKLTDAQRSLQKWNAAIRVTTGCPASNPLRGQGRVLSLLSDGNPRRQREMCDDLHVRPQSLGEMLTKLEKSGLVIRTPAEDNSHSLMVQITEAGKEQIAHQPYLREFESFSKEELVQFIDYIDRFMVEIERQRKALLDRHENGGAE